jgi:hypothetical protein
VELFEQIRREYECGEGTIKGVARKLGIHRRMVREALGDAIPRERKITSSRAGVSPAEVECLSRRTISPVTIQDIPEPYTLAIRVWRARLFLFGSHPGFQSVL